MIVRISAPLSDLDDIRKTLCWLHEIRFQTKPCTDPDYFEFLAESNDKDFGDCLLAIRNKWPNCDIVVAWDEMRQKRLRSQDQFIKKVMESHHG